MNRELLLRPSLLFRKALGKVRRRMVRLPETTVTKTLGGTVRFEHRRERFLNDDDLRAMLAGSYDILLCDFLKEHLRTGDVFIDVGANVGYISAVAAALVGPSGEVHSFEPLKECFARLELLAKLNPGYQFALNNVALGDVEGSLPISYDPDHESRNATLVPGHHLPDSVEVPVRRLDDYILREIRQPERISMIKIDVEGFEASVLKGLDRFFQTSWRPLIICEIKPWEIAKLGSTLEELDGYMRGHSYRASALLTPQRALRLADLEDIDTVLFST